MVEVLAVLNQPIQLHVSVAMPLELCQCVRLEGVRFRYGPDQVEVLQGIDLEIRRGERLGLIGSTGSGKSTTVDLLMGLLTPSAGRVLVDGEDLHEPTKPKLLVAWRASIAHVPQNIYLTDNSIAENIAFGTPYDDIDIVRVNSAAEKAQIANYIESTPEGYQSLVGEQGIRLSGGQRQRIGIARALYKDARILVFDEATSALDTQPEDVLMAALDELSRFNYFDDCTPSEHFAAL